MSSSRSSVFYDQSDTHLFSDWLFPYVFEENFGIPDRSELYLGGFPDLEPLIIRSEGVSKVDSSHLAELSLSRFGKQMQELIRGRSIYDFGCGRPELSVGPRLLAQYLGAGSYTGIDLSHCSNEIRENEFPELGNFKTEFVQSDLFDFIEKISDEDLSKSKGFFLIGLEWLNEDFKRNLLPQLEKEIVRVLNPSDWILLGAGGFDWELPAKDFQLIYSDPVHALYLKKKKPKNFLSRLIFRNSN